MPRIKNNHFKSLVKKQYKDYEKINKKIEKIYNKYDDTKEPHKVGAIAKTMTAYGVDIKTIMDDTDSKIAELCPNYFRANEIASINTGKKYGYL